jgi:hypothetical protein
MIDYSVFFNRVLTKAGFDLVAEYNCYNVGYDTDQGWPMKLPDVDFGSNTLLLLHFQDFVTRTDRGVLELLRVEQHYGDRAAQVLVTYWPHRLQHYYTGPVNLIEFNSHEYAIIQNLKQCQTAWYPRLQASRPVAWQSLNGRKCPHRQRVCRVLSTWPNGVLSLGDCVSLDQWPYSTYRGGTTNEDNYLRLIETYGSCAVNIVTETQYDRAPGIITEKTIFAMLSEQIPVIVGYPGVVADCQDLGFDMFTDVVDTAYDYAPNDTRVELALELNRNLILGLKDLDAYRLRLRCQREFLLDYYPNLLEYRFTIAVESLARSWPGIR